MLQDGIVKMISRALRAGRRMHRTPHDVFQFARGGVDGAGRATRRHRGPDDVRG